MINNVVVIISIIEHIELKQYTIFLIFIRLLTQDLEPVQ